MAVNFYAGDTFNFAGALNFPGHNPAGFNGTSGTRGNQPDYSLWSITAKMFDATGDDELYTFQVTNLSNAALPETNGLYTVQAPSSDTALWKPGKVQIIVQLTISAGATQTSDPMWFRILKNPAIK